jgi:hypothetical protein
MGWRWRWSYPVCYGVFLLLLPQFGYNCYMGGGMDGHGVKMVFSLYIEMGFEEEFI